MMRLPAVGLLCALLVGCGDNQRADGVDRPTATTAVGSAPVVHSDGFVLPPQRSQSANPLGLPPSTLTLAKGTRVFAVPETMLEGSKLGSALMLRSAKVMGQDEQDLIVRVGFGRNYRLHPGYVVVPRKARFRRNGEVIAGYRGRLRHGVVKGLSRDKVVVRFTDLGFKLSDQKLSPERVGVLGDGLVPGAFAVYRSTTEYRHVLLVSSAVHEDGKTRWLVLDHDGDSQLIDSDALQRVGGSRFNPKVGATVLVAWRGDMVRAQVRSIDRPGLYTIARQRAGAPLLVGPGMMMTPD